ncbi:MAG TPA: M18 family aminopeptidase [Roseburia sp.]|nr:M18 family aminopeptidase [Roseburia sp.]
MQKIIELLSQGKSPCHVTEWTGKQLEGAGYEELKIQESWQLAAGGKYYVRPYSGMVVAFSVPEQMNRKTALRLMFAHTDFPCFKIKPNPEVKTKDYWQLNVEPYGGMLKNTWFDRPLGIYGKVVLESENPFVPKVNLFGSEEPVAVIPSLAPHLNREAGGKQEYDMQRELLPLLGMEKEQEKEDFFLVYIKKKLGVEASEILSYDLFLTNMDEPELIGWDKTLLSSPRIDNLASVAAIVEAMCEKTAGESLAVAGLFDNEEIGSRSKQGADSSLMRDIIRKIGAAFGMTETEVNDMLRGGFLLSVDGAHAVHPNYTNKSDITNDVILGKGITVKTSASQRYLSDSEATAVVMQLCKKADIPYQVQVNRSGMPGGQTLGPIAVSYLPMQGADIGLPMLAMHSARELADIRDYHALASFLKIFSA